MLNPKAPQQLKKPSWKVHAYFLDACNCEGIAGYHIITGSYGTRVKLDGLNMAFIISFPGPLHEGHGKASYYIDSRADERQFEALSKIITGRAEGGPFSVYASILEETQEPKKAIVKFQTKDIRSRVSVFGTSEDKKPRIGGEQSKNVIAEAWLEPIRSPVTGKAHRAIIEIPEGFESSRMDQA